mmetsp:Transcript_15746/g.11441  ORF Transcript_15746/g.11441 Transcript_15746/m.11441 type:complete len:108 (-) Transcript_15746:4-327(-)
MFRNILYEIVFRVAFHSKIENMTFSLLFILPDSKHMIIEQLLILELFVTVTALVAVIMELFHMLPKLRLLLKVFLGIGLFFRASLTKKLLFMLSFNMFPLLISVWEI